MSASRVVVVGTTSDYIELILRRCPDRAVFLTDAAHRAQAAEPAPHERSEVLCDLAEREGALAALLRHLDQWDIEASGVACFDDESMALAADVACALGLPYVSHDTVAACRSKLECKRLWAQAGLPCPQVALVRSAADAVAFLRRTGGSAVLKPLTGSGSELTFLCRDERACLAAFRALETGLPAHHDARMYAPQRTEGRWVDPRREFAIEEFVEGSEHSCDFVIDGDAVQLIRCARKVPAEGQSFGTTLAYVVPADLPADIAPERLGRQLRDAAHAVGARRAICMVDFVVRGGEAVMLELAPRPGGDCLPPLILASSGLDMLRLTLDFAERRPIAVPPRAAWRRLVGLRLFAERAGTISRLDTSALLADPRVIDCYLKRSVGHQVVLPPADYDSRLLGHVTVEPAAGEAVNTACTQIAAKLDLEMDPATCAAPTTF